MDATRWEVEATIDGIVVSNVVERLTTFAGAHGHSLLELAFAWLLASPPVASVIAGVTSPEQVRANAAAAGWQLTSAELSDLQALLDA